MKLIKLKILEDFRSLKIGFEMNFHDVDNDENLLMFHPFCLAGTNGSGKSNVLEALANIFYHLECCTNSYPDYAFEKTISSPDSYDIDYYIAQLATSVDISDLSLVRVQKRKGKAPRMSIGGGTFKEITKSFGASFLPDLVVGYSSGENETLSLPFAKTKLFQYDEYIKDFRNEEVYDRPKSSLLYIDYEMSQAVLLTILLFFDFKEEDGSLGVLHPLEEELGITGIQQFTINLHNNWQKLLQQDDNLTVVTSVNKDYHANHQEEKYLGRILDHLNDQLILIEECATCVYKDENFRSLDFWIDGNTKNLIREKFQHKPYDFFSVFQMLQSLNERVEDRFEKEEVYRSKGYYTDYKKPEYSSVFYFTNYFLTQVNKATGKENNLLLKQLSDGQQQFLHSLGICLMLQKRRTLLLLDEPETHFNPSWRSKFIYILSKTLTAGGDNFLLKDVIMTSHSPFIISDCKPENVILFRKDSKQNVTAISAKELNFNTYGASVDLILQEIFAVEHSISEQALGEIKELLKNDSLSQIIDGSKRFGESYEKAFLFERIAQLQEIEKNKKNI